MFNQSTFQTVGHLLLTLTTLALTSCSGPKPSGKVDNKLHGTISEKEAVDRATKEFLGMGERLKDYRVSVTTDNLPNAEEWRVYFEHKVPRVPPGCTFFVDKRTGKVRHGIDK